MRFLLTITLSATLASTTLAADFDFFGRSGDLIEIDLSRLPGVPAGATFTGLQTPTRHTRLLSDTLAGTPFSSSGKFWFAPNPAANTPGLGDSDPTARGFQGVLSGSVVINGETKTFQITVRKGHTGTGRGQVGQSLEGLGRTNNPLFVAQQQQRLKYLGFVAENSALVPVSGTFDTATDSALRTFQAAIIGGVNTTQAGTDGIVGPTTASWFNAANAPAWERLVDPDPQSIPWSINRLTGDFDILPGRDPGTGQRTGNTPQFEDYATSWTLEVIRQGSAAAKLATGRTQLVNALSAADGYGSDCCHNTHRAGMDFDLHVHDSTWNFGNGTVSTEENIVAQHAVAFIDHAAPDGRIARIITSNVDIMNRILALRPGTAFFNDTSGGHQNHLHIDVGHPTRQTDPADLRGDFNLDEGVTSGDIDLLRKNFGGNGSIYNLAGSATEVDQVDLNELVRGVLGTEFGDANLDRRVDALDGAKILSQLGSAPGRGWADGDFNGDGRVTASQDGSIVLQNFGFDGNPPALAALSTPGTVQASFDPRSGKLVLEANAVSLLVLRSPGSDLEALLPIPDFGGAATVDQPNPGEISWLNFSDGLTGKITLQLATGLSDLQMFSQVIRGTLLPISIVSVPEPSSWLLGLMAICSGFLIQARCH